jgi:hypothetical protein
MTKKIKFDICIHKFTFSIELMRCEALDKQKDNVSYVGMKKKNEIFVLMITIPVFIRYNYQCIVTKILFNEFH